MILSNPNILGGDLDLTIPPGATGLVGIASPSSTDNAICRWDGATGDLVQNSAATIADTSGSLTIATATASVTLGAATETVILAATAAGAGTITTKAGQNLTLATGSSGAVVSSGTGTSTFAGNVSLTGATGTLTLGTATEILTVAATAAGAGTITTKAGQNLTLATGASGAVVSSGTGTSTFAGNVSLTGATGTVTLGTATETLSVAATAAGAGTITTKAGQNLTIANGASGGVLATGTGSHVFGTTNTVTMAAGVLTATSTLQGTEVIPTNSAITAGSGTGVTVNTANVVRQSVYKVTTTYAAFAAAALTADKTIATLPAKTRLTAVYADVTATFTGGAVSDADITLGNTAGGAQYLASFDVDTATGQRGLADADMGTELTRAAAIQGSAVVTWAGTTTVTARLTTVGANTDQLTTGSITWYLITEQLP